MASSLLSIAAAATSLAGAFAVQAPVPADVLTAMNAANSYFMANNPTGDCGWTRGTYYAGNMAHYISTCEMGACNASVLNFSSTWALGHNYSCAGSINANDEACGQSYVDLYKLDPNHDPKYLNLQYTLDKQVASNSTSDWCVLLSWTPRGSGCCRPQTSWREVEVNDCASAGWPGLAVATCEPSSALTKTHRHRMPDPCVLFVTGCRNWVDALFMALPTWSEFGNVTGEYNYNHNYRAVPASGVDQARSLVRDSTRECRLCALCDQREYPCAAGNPAYWKKMYQLYLFTAYQDGNQGLWSAEHNLFCELRSDLQPLHHCVGHHRAPVVAHAACASTRPPTMTAPNTAHHGLCSHCTRPHSNLPSLASPAHW